MIQLLEYLQSESTEFEKAAYSGVSKFEFGLNNVGEDTEYLYSRLSSGPWCKQTTALLGPAVKSLICFNLRRERHYDAYGEHFFLTIPVLGKTVLAASDVVIDPTYKQFLNPDLIGNNELPNIFIGTRMSIFELMQTPPFVESTFDHDDWGTSPNIFLEKTLVELEDI